MLNQVQHDVVPTESMGVVLDCHTTLVSAVLLCLALVTSCAAEALLPPFKGLPHVEFTFDFGDRKLVWSLQSSDADSALYTWEDYSLKLDLRKSGRLTRLAFEVKSKSGPARLHGYGVKVTVPCAGLHSVMIPNIGPIAHTLDYFGQHHKWPDKKLYRCLIPDGFEENAQTNSDAPFILLAKQRGENAVTVGWAAADRNTRLQSKADGENYVLALDRREDIAFSGDPIRDELVICTQDAPWFDVATDYYRSFDEFNARVHGKVPEWSDEPVFCTWYCYGDHIDRDGLLKIARKCKELGFGTILVDAGWDCRPDGGYIDFEHGILGDYKAVPDRFPDFPDTVRKIKEMGLRVELWSAPFWEGKESEAYRTITKDWHVHTDKGQNHALCPRHPGLRDYLRERFAWVARAYGIDGMWLDAADAVPPVCIANHPHVDKSMGEAFVDCMMAVHDGLRSVNPEAITEGRILHVNANTKLALDLVQPSDAPESYEILRLQSIHMRPWTRGIVLKNDPMFWKKKADAATVGKFLATMMMCGVPALSVDYLTAPEEQCKLTSVWLAYYRKNKQTLLHGDFRLFGADYGSPDMIMTDRNQAFVYLKNPDTREAVLPQSVPKITVFNVTDSDQVRLSIGPAEGKWTVRAFKPDWTASGESQSLSAASGKLELSLPVPQGGAAVIEQL